MNNSKLTSHTKSHVKAKSPVKLAATKAKSPVKLAATKAKSPVKLAATKAKSVKKELVKFATKNKKTLTRSAIGSAVLGLYAINRKAIHKGLGNVLNRVTKPTQDEFINNVKEVSKETITNLKEALNAKNSKGKTIIQQNVNDIIADNVYLADTVIPQAVNKILEENKDLASGIVSDAVLKLVIQGKDKIVNDFTNLIGYATTLNKNINQTVDDIVIDIFEKNQHGTEEEKQQIKDVEEYLRFKGQLEDSCSDYFKVPGGYPCADKVEADKLIVKYVISPEFQKLVKEFHELKLVEKIEKYLIDTNQLKKECSTYHQPWIRWNSCNDKNAADLLVRDSVQKYKTDPDFKGKIPK